MTRNSNFPTKSKYKTWMSLFTTLIQHHTRRLCKYKKAKK